MISPFKTESHLLEGGMLQSTVTKWDQTPSHWARTDIVMGSSMAAALSSCSGRQENVTSALLTQESTDKHLTNVSLLFAIEASGSSILCKEHSILHVLIDALDRSDRVWS